MVKDTLDSFHFHVTPPKHRGCRINQNLRSISFSSFATLTTLHVPLQLLLGKDRNTKLRNQLPQSLVNLWLNDDGLALWVNHNRFRNFHHYYDESADHFHDPLFHPIRTDQEIIAVMLDFLADWRSSTPLLRAIKLLFYKYWPVCFDPRDVSSLAASLEPCSQDMGLKIRVYHLPWRPNYHHSRYDVQGQVAPYFNEEVVEQMRLPNDEMPF